MLESVENEQTDILKDPSISVRGAIEANERIENIYKQIIEQKIPPKVGLNDHLIKILLSRFALLDSNNFYGNVGAGEREGRVFSNLVSESRFNLAHGIGRSGDVSAVQPKAIGSSLINKLTTSFVLNLIKKRLNISSAAAALILPLATGMGMILCFLCMRIKEPLKKYVVWCRIDQKTCLKAIVSAGLTPVIVEPIVDGDVVRIDAASVQSAISKIGLENVLCVVTTTSCFAPRAPDDVIAISNLCKTQNIFHLINNAYGLQCSKICHSIAVAANLGRVDFVVQSTDKNFMVPVGGSIVFSPDRILIKDLSETYAGRASSAPIVDLFITFLSLGAEGYVNLRKRRQELVDIFKTQVSEIIVNFGERMLQTKSNSISFAITIGTGRNLSQKQLTEFGSMLFKRGVSGARVVPRNFGKEVGGIKFDSYGSSCSDYHSDYFTLACAIGITKEDIQVLCKRLQKTFVAFYKKYPINPYQ